MNTAAFVLILFFYGVQAGGSSSTSLTTAEFKSFKACEDAGEKAVTMSIDDRKKFRYVCSPK